MTASTAPSRVAGLWRHAPTAVAIVLLIWAVQWFSARWAVAFREGVTLPIDARWLVVAGALLVVHAATAVVIWRQALRGVGVELTPRVALDLFAPSILPRYIPGRLWANAARVALAKRVGITLTRTSGAFIWETAIALATAALVAGVGLAGRVDGTYVWTAFGLLAAVVAFVAMLAVTARATRVATWLARLGSSAMVPPPVLLLRTALVAMVGWLCFGLAHVAVARSVASVGLSDLPLVIGSTALAWAIGFVAIIVPLGLGVRDGLLVVLLTSLLSPPQALLFVALARLVQLAVDISITAGWLVLALRRPSVAPSAVHASRDPRAAGD